MNSLAAAVVSHSDAELEVLERVAYIGDDLAEARRVLRSLPGLVDATILATCNRTEVYAIFDGDADPARLGWFLSQDRNLCWGRLHDSIGLLQGRDAVSHLFSVAAGIESLAFGEVEIMGQVREVHSELDRGGHTDLKRLFEWALRAGRSVRKRTGVMPDRSSLGVLAVSTVESVLGSVPRRVLVVGAGKIARAVVSGLDASTQLVVASRTFESAERLAGGNGTAVALSEIGNELARADAAFFCASSRHPLLTRGSMAHTERGRTNAVVMVDLGLPRNVDSSIRALAGVNLFDLADLRVRWSETTAHLRVSGDFDALLAEEVERYAQALHSQRIGPFVSQLRARVDELSKSSLDRAYRVGDPLRERAQKAIDYMAGILLHSVIMEARHAASVGDERVLEALTQALGTSVSPPTPTEEEKTEPMDGEVA